MFVWGKVEWHVKYLSRFQNFVGRLKSGVSPPQITVPDGATKGKNHEK